MRHVRTLRWQLERTRERWCAGMPLRIWRLRALCFRSGLYVMAYLRD
jgi:hypothetical protein